MIKPSLEVEPETEVVDGSQMVARTFVVRVVFFEPQTAADCLEVPLDRLEEQVIEELEAVFDPIDGAQVVEIYEQPDGEDPSVEEW